MQVTVTGIYLTITLETHSVSALPGGTERPTNNPVGPVTLLAEPAALSAGGRQPAHLAVLVNRVDDPVDSRVVADLRMGRVDENHLIVFHGGILVDPVAVEDTKVGVFAPDLLLRDALKVALELELVNTLVLGLSEDHPTMVLSLSSASSDPGPDDHIALLGLVPQSVGLVGASRAVAGNDVGPLAVLPRPHAEKEAESIRLLVPPQLLEVLVRSHGS